MGRMVARGQHRERNAHHDAEDRSDHRHLEGHQHRLHHRQEAIGRRRHHLRGDLSHVWHALEQLRDGDAGGAERPDHKGQAGAEDNHGNGARPLEALGQLAEGAISHTSS
ncbi:hypothetical protein D3C78_1488120 [compost metagenome]